MPDLVNEAVLLSSLDHAGPVLPQGGHNAEKIYPLVPLQDGLEANVTGQQHTCTSDARGTVDHSWTFIVRHLYRPGGVETKHNRIHTERGEDELR